MPPSTNCPTRLPPVVHAGPRLAHETVSIVLTEPATLKLTLAITRGVGNYPATLLVDLDEEPGGEWRFDSNTTDALVVRMYDAAVEAFSPRL